MEHVSNFHAVVGEEPDVFENRSTMFTSCDIDR
jgi:hypothetical protein